MKHRVEGIIEGQKLWNVYVALAVGRVVVVSRMLGSAPEN